MENLKKSGLSIQNRQGFNREIDIFSEENKFSVYNLISGQAKFIKEKILEVPEDMRNQDHYSFRKEVEPSPTLNALRINFWAEYDRAMGDKRTMRMQNVVAGVCTVNTLKKIINNDIKDLAWILTPVQSYQAGMQDILETCLFKMRQAIERMSMYESKDLSAVMRVYEAFDKRLHGEYTQKIEKKEEITYKSTAVPEIKNEMEKLGIQNDVIEVAKEKK